MTTKTKPKVNPVAKKFDFYIGEDICNLTYVDPFNTIDEMLESSQFRNIVQESGWGDSEIFVLSDDGVNLNGAKYHLTTRWYNLVKAKA